MEPATSKRRSRLARPAIGVLLISLSVLLVALFLSLRGKAIDPHRVSQAVPQPETARQDREPEPPFRRAAAPVAPPRGVVIDRVSVDKQEICAGEDLLVEVSAHAADARREPELITMVGVAQGRMQVLRPWEAPKLRISAFAGEDVASATFPEVRIKDCYVARGVMVGAQRRMNTNDEYDVSCAVVDFAERVAQERAKRGLPAETGVASAPFLPVRYRFSFGDGTTLDSTEGRVVHSYEGRPQGEMMSSFLVSCEVENDKGEKLLGRTALSMVNAGFEALKAKGIVQVFASYEPRYPEADANGTLRQRIRLWHIWHEPVTISEMQVTSRRPREREVVATVAPEAVLGTRVIPPGRGLEITLTQDLDQDAAEVTSFAMHGSVSDLDVQGIFSLMRPPRPLTRETMTPISDPKLKEAIHTAMNLLGKKEVTEEDLRRLRSEGKLDPIYGKWSPRN